MMKYLSDANWWKQASILVGGLLEAIWTFLATLNIHYAWFTDKSINAFVAMIIAFGSLFVGVIATLVNTYLSEHSKKKAKQVVSDYDEQQKQEAAAKLEEAKKLVELANQAKIGDAK